jgi:hypothetical protein
MAVYRILGDKLLSKADFASQLSATGGLESTESAASHALAAAFESPAGLENNPAVTQFVPIGLGKPLTILIREIYTGRHPTKGFLGSSAKPMAVVTGLKDYSVYAASSRAVNFLQNDIRPKTRFKAPSTFNDGTNVVAYSPAVVTDSFHFTVEMAFDRFDGGLFEILSKGLSAAAGIPILMPAAGYLMAAGGLIKIGSELADGLIDGKAAFSVTDSLDFNMPGVAAPTADFRVMCNFDASGMRYDPARGLLNKDGTVYNGDEPYVVVSLDGAVRKNLESFAPTVAAAGVMKQFFNARNGAEVSMTALIEGMKLANDMKYRGEAEDLKKQLAAASAEDKAALQARLDALNKNILSDVLKVTAA